MAISVFRLVLASFKFCQNPLSGWREVKCLSQWGEGGHLYFPIDKDNTNLVKDVQYLLPYKFRKIPFVIYGQISKARLPPLIDSDIFDYMYRTTEQNSTKLVRKQEFDILYQVCVFWCRSENQGGRPGLWLTETSSTSPLQTMNGIQQNLPGIKYSTSSTVSVFSHQSEYEVGRTTLCLAVTPWHFRIFFCNNQAEINETQPEATSQHPLPSLCFTVIWIPQDGSLYWTETFSTSLQPLKIIQRNLIESKNWHPLQRLWLLGRSEKQEAA